MFRFDSMIAISKKWWELRPSPTSLWHLRFAWQVHGRPSWPWAVVVCCCCAPWTKVHLFFQKFGWKMVWLTDPFSHHESGNPTLNHVTCDLWHLADIATFLDCHLQPLSTAIMEFPEQNWNALWVDQNEVSTFTGIQPVPIQMAF